MTEWKSLIKDQCPDGVPFVQLGELGKFYGGISGKSKEDFIGGNAKFITYKNVYANPALSLDVEDKVNISEDEKQRTLQYGDVIFTGSSETPDECGISSVLTQKTNEKLYLNSFCFFFRFDDSNIILPDFAKYLFRSDKLRYQIGKTASGVTRYNVSKKLMERVVIPVPPLNVQKYIISILDDLSEQINELTNLLTDEADLRRMQFEESRNIVLDFSQMAGANIVQLKDIATSIYRGNGIKRDEVTAEGVPCVRYGEIYTTYETSFKQCVSHTRKDVVKSPKYFSKGDILFAITGESVEDIAKSIAYLGEDICLAGGDIVVMKHNQEPRYLAHALSTTNARRQKSKGKIKSKVVHSNVPSIEAIEIPIPPLRKQIELADILDEYESLCRNICSEIDSEVSLRLKQYEYCRDTLLDFKVL